jgi:hypothetical protein
MALSAEMQALLAALKADVLPELIEAAKTAATDAVEAASPVAAVIAVPVIDEIDAYVQGLLGNPVPVVTAPVDAVSQIKSLQQHVAALTVATGHATSAAMPTAKAIATTVKVNAPAPDSGS